MNITVKVNKKPVTRTVEARRLLVDFLREDLNLTGTNVGCDSSQCGACMVNVNGELVKSCTVLAVQADGAEITTIEGLAEAGEFHPVQAAFWDKHGLQCGFCTPGIIMATLSLLKENPTPDDADIKHALEGNLCRCTGYQNIILAVKEAAKRLQEVAA